jgi:norsolorinic acid ketoreductase
VGIGIAGLPGPVQNVDPKIFKEMFQVNTLGPLHMYQATYPLLIESRAGNKHSNAPVPKFFVTSSALGSMGGFYEKFIVAPYGVSKAAVNYLALSIHHQTKDVGAVVIPYHPGKPRLTSRAAID